MAIRWRDSDAKKLANAVRQYNAKLTRTAKKNPALTPYLPRRITVQEIRNRVSDRNDFNREISRLQRIIRPDSLELKALPGGAITTKYEYNILRADVQRINRQRAEIVKRYGIVEGSGRMGSIAANNLRQKRFNISGSQEEWEAQRRSITNQARGNYLEEEQQRAKSNYLSRLDKLIEEASQYAEYTPKQNDLLDSLLRLKALISSLSPEQVYEAGLSESSLAIDFLYGGEEGNADYIEEITLRWQEYLGG